MTWDKNIFLVFANLENPTHIFSLRFPISNCVPSKFLNIQPNYWLYSINQLAASPLVMSPSRQSEQQRAKLQVLPTGGLPSTILQGSAGRAVILQVFTCTWCLHIAWNHCQLDPSFLFLSADHKELPVRP